MISSLRATVALTAPYRRPSNDKSDFGNRPGDGPLRPGGVPSPIGGPVAEKDLPSTPSKAAQRQQGALTLVRDLWNGTERIRERGTTYLPKSPGESPANYSIRLQRSVFFNVFRKTIEGLAGFVFAKDPVLDETDVPAQIVEQWENIDNAGTHGDVFLRDIFHDALTSGHAAILVEYPNTGGVQLYSDERGSNAAVRPYWVPIKKDDLLSWRTAVIDGKTVLTQLVVKECTMVPDGQFGEKEQTRFRVFYRNLDSGVVGFALLAETDKKEVILVDEGTYPTQEEIPVAEIVTSGRASLFESTPPLLDLAYLNIAHYQQYSDYAYSMHKTSLPIIVRIGFVVDGETPGKVEIGPNSLIDIPNPDGDLKVVEHTGTALGSSKQALDDLKSDMATLGVAMLSSQKRAAETAEAKKIDKAGADSALAVSARGLQDGAERAMGFHARYYRLPSGGSITINRDFGDTSLDPAMLTAFVSAVSQAGIPVRLLLELLKRGNLIAAETNIEELEAEIMANVAAKEAEEQRQRDAQLEVMKAKAGSMTGQQSGAA